MHALVGAESPEHERALLLLEAAEIELVVVAEELPVFQSRGRFFDQTYHS